jgi:acyl-CoA thioesterase-1
LFKTFIMLLIFLTQALTVVEAQESRKSIIFFGDSLTIGLGVSPDEAYPALIQNYLNRDRLNYDVVNAGVSGETTTDGLNRLNWSLRTKPDVFVLALGANDGLRGLPPKMMRDNLLKIISQVRQSNTHVKIILAGIDIPTNMGEVYRDELKAVFSKIAAEENLPLIPFLLLDVAGKRELNQEDGIHPNPEGHRIIAENVWKILKKNLD